MAITLAHARTWITSLAAVYQEKKEYLTDLDSAIGDADHGINLDRGFTAAEAALNDAQPDSLSILFKSVAMTLIKTVGGASGPLYGTWFLTASKSAADLTEMDTAAFATLVRASTDAVKARGMTEVGAKTMIDVWEPVAQLLEEQASDGVDVKTAIAAAAELADAQVQATIPMRATRGRASFLGERSIGHPDPGATSSAYMLHALEQQL